MKINLRSFITILFSSVVLLTTAQNQITQRNSNTLSEPAERCKSNIIHQQLLQTDPQYALKVQENEQNIQQIISSGNVNRVGGVYTIPVVVHILHLGEAIGTGTNISTAQINSAIANLNQCYSGGGSYPLDIEVQFQLAQRTPSCGSTTGIVRVNASAVSDYATNGITSANEVTIKAISKWPNGEYYNIWIVSEIDGNNGGAGTQGYAYFPGASASRDGSVILYNSFGYDPTETLGYNLKTYTNYNTTANHELGHAFNLYHTFQGDGDGSGGQCPANASCTADGDLCCDTEPHNRNDGNCGSTGTSCNGGSLTNVVQNIMAYSSDYCQMQFTADQKARMRAAISGPRATLLTSPALTPVSGSSPTAVKSCSPQTTNLVDNYGMGIYRLKIGTVQYGSSGTISDGGFRNNWCSNFSLNPNTSYTIEIDNGSLNPEKVKVYIDYNNDGDFSDSGEEVYSDAVGAMTHSGNFTTAVAPVDGQALWVRVISDFYNITGPCYAPTHGQVEDFSVTFPSTGCTPPTVNTTPVSPDCNGGTNGSATANASGGTSPYTYLWNTGAVTQAISNIGAGTYTVTVTDDAGCSASRTAVVANPATLSLSTVSQSSSCPDNDGSINLTVSGGTGGYTYSWSNGSITQDISGLAQGGYTVTVSDANGCTAQRTTTVTRVCVANTQVAASQCGQTVPDLSGSFYCNAVTNVQDYEWEFVNAGLGYSFTKKRGASAPYIEKALITGLKPGTAYNVRVRAMVGGVWGNFSTTCAITISATIPTTKVATSQCGQTLADLSGQFYCNFVSGAQDYEWEFVNAGLGYSFTKKRGSSATSIDRVLITGLKHGQSYNVRVRALVGGVWGNYGDVCVITISATIPTTKVATNQCGQTLADLSGSFYCNAVAGAQDYEWEFVNVGLGYSFTKKRGASSNAIERLLITGLKHGQAYNVRVRALVAGVWANFGDVCVITISATIPTTKVTTSQCDQTMNLNGSFYCNAVSGVQDYEWEFVNAGLGYSFTKKRGASANYILKSLITGLQNGVTYNVRVRALVGGTWGNFGTVCTITINTSMGIVVEKDPVYNNTTSTLQEKTVDSEKEYQLAVFPNPSNNSGFNLALDGIKHAACITVEVYDMFGKRVWTENVYGKENGQITKINGDGSFSSGVYLINVQLNGQLLQQKVIVQ